MHQKVWNRKLYESNVFCVAHITRFALLTCCGGNALHHSRRRRAALHVKIEQQEQSDCCRVSNRKNWQGKRGRIGARAGLGHGSTLLSDPRWSGARAVQRSLHRDAQAPACCGSDHAPIPRRTADRCRSSTSAPSCDAYRFRTNRRGEKSASVGTRAMAAASYCGSLGGCGSSVGSIDLRLISPFIASSTETWFSSRVVPSV